MKNTIGVLAHVDAGKTTFCEQLLFHTNSIRTLGRVDHRNTFLDYNDMERERGITIFMEQAVFQIEDDTYFLLDTPGHVDFSTQMERALDVLDYAILIISCVDGIQAHTRTVFRLLKERKIPTIIFINKTDRPHLSMKEIIDDIKIKLDTFPVNLTDNFAEGILTEEVVEIMAELDEELLEDYLEYGFTTAKNEDYCNRLQYLIKKMDIIPCFYGSALQDIGIEDFITKFRILTSKGEKDPTEHQLLDDHIMTAKVFKIKNDDTGNRVVFMKLIKGQMKVKDEIPYFDLSTNEMVRDKINQIRIYNGRKYSTVDVVKAGDICAVTGLKNVTIGTFIGNEERNSHYQLRPMVAARVICDSVTPHELLKDFRLLEDEDPMLKVEWNESLGQLRVHIMGKVQLDILKQIVADRFHKIIEFGPCEVQYLETIAFPVVGYGHYEPLRHYAEVHLELVPNERGRGILFENTCSYDDLDSNFQNLVKTHVLEKDHKGVLTGSSLTDITFVLKTGRSHLKHTEGGDFRQAVYRCIRQGLMQAETILLEPIYRFEIEAHTDYMGRILSDIQRYYGSFDTPKIKGDNVLYITGRVPVSTFMNYQLEFISFTGGTGSLSLMNDGYEICHNQEEVVLKIGYEKDRDYNNPSSSVFCSHGAGFEVKWDEVENYIHCK